MTDFGYCGGGFKAATTVASMMVVDSCGGGLGIELM